MRKCGLCGEKYPWSELTYLDCVKLRASVSSREVETWPEPLRTKKAVWICDKCYGMIERDYALNTQLLWATRRETK